MERGLCVRVLTPGLRTDYSRQLVSLPGPLEYCPNAWTERSVDGRDGKGSETEIWDWSNSIT